METHVRILQATDRSLAMGILAAAFISDPINRWLFPNPRTYLDVFEAYAEAFAGAAIDLGHGYIADEYRGVALWLPPGVSSEVETLAEIIFTNCSEGVIADIPTFHGADRDDAFCK
jgi:hypothetical protein